MFAKVVTPYRHWVRASFFLLSFLFAVIGSLIEKPQPAVADVSAAGLRGEYFDNEDFTGLKLTRTDATVDFNWGFASPDPLINPETFSIRWTGQLIAPVSGNYVLVTQSDDGVRLWLGNQLMIDNFTSHPLTEDRSSSIALNAGQSYNLRLEYFEMTANAIIRLMWIRPGQTAPEIIPSSNLVTPVNPNAAPVLSALSPNIIPSGNSSVNLTVNGSSFLQGAIVQFNNQSRVTSFINSGQLTAVIPAADIAFASLAKITVVNPLPGGGTSNPLMLTITGGFEADVQPRPTGNNNGTVTIADWTQLGRFSSGLDVAANGGEFQRADCAPKSGLGDGRLTLTDWVQAGRYAAALDPAVAAGGPAVPVNSFSAAPSDSLTGDDTGNSAAEFHQNSLFEYFQFHRMMSLKYRIPDRQIYFSPQSSNSIAVVLSGGADANAAGFSFRYDASRWQFVSAIPGKAANQAVVFVNDRLNSTGRVGIALALPAGQQMKADEDQLLVLTFRPRFGNIANVFSPTMIEFTDHPVPRELVNAKAENLRVVFAMVDKMPALARLESARTLRR